MSDEPQYGQSVNSSGQLSLSLNTWTAFS